MLCDLTRRSHGARCMASWAPAHKHIPAARYFILFTAQGCGLYYIPVCCGFAGVCVGLL